MDRAEVQRFIGLARAAYAASDHAEASVHAERVLAVVPGEPSALHMRASIRRAAGDANGALRDIDAALQAAPRVAPMHVMRGELLLALQNPNAALGAFDLAAAEGLAHPAVWSGRGVALSHLGRAEEAAACFAQCVAYNPRDADARYNHGRALQALDRLTDALAAYDAAIALKPNDAAMHQNRAVLLQWMDRRAESERAFDAALRLDPDREATLYSKGVALMAFGDYTRGWPLIELRLKPGVISTARNHAREEPAWQGQKLDGALRIWPEQGIGDEVLFARLAPLMLARTENVILECAARLKPLFARAFPQLEVRALDEGESAQPAAAQLAIGSIGAALALDASQISGAPFLMADETLKADLRARYEAVARGRPIIGIAWRSTNTALGQYKSTDLADWGALLRGDALFVDLQYGDTDADRAAAHAAFGCEIVRDAAVDQMADLDAFVAQVAAMDQIVSVSNTTVHVAGALGVPCTMLAPPAQGLLWYWGASGARTPWYDSVSIERRKEGEPWAAQIARAAARLGF